MLCKCHAILHNFRAHYNAVLVLAWRHALPYTGHRIICACDKYVSLFTNTVRIPYISQRIFFDTTRRADHTVQNIVIINGQFLPKIIAQWTPAQKMWVYTYNHHALLHQQRVTTSQVLNWTKRTTQQANLLSSLSNMRLKFGPVSSVSGVRFEGLYKESRIAK